MIANDHGYAEFINVCCQRDVSGEVRCSHGDDDKWITILYFSITALKVSHFSCAYFLKYV